MTSTSRVTLKFKARILPALLLLLIFLEIFFPFKGWLILILALSLAWLFSTITIQTLKNHLTITREMRFGWAKVGDTLEQRVTVQNTCIFSTVWLEIQDHTTIPGQQTAIGTNVGANSHIQWRSRNLCTRRGLFRIGPTALKTGDLFGFYSLTIHNPKETHILITPPVVPLPEIRVSSGGQTGDGKQVTGVLEQSVATSTIRDYQPEDPFHHIHWPITAKRNTLTTRVFENTPTGNWWILQDMNRSAQVGKDNRHTLEAGVILSASLANKGLSDGKAVGFIANNQQKSWIPPQHHGGQNMKILKALALSEESDLFLEEMLNRIHGSFHQPASLIIITPDVSLKWLEPLIWLAHKGLTPTVIILDPLSFGGRTESDNLLKTLKRMQIHHHLIKAEHLAGSMEISESPLWEWRVFGTGYAVPVKKPEDTRWKALK